MRASNNTAAVTTIFTLVLLVTVVQEATSYINCQCHVENSSTSIIGIDCKKDASGSPVCTKEVRPFIPVGYRYIPGVGLIKLHSLSKSYASAQKECEKEGGRLATPQNRVMAEAMASIFPPNGPLHYGWVGINDIASTGYYQGSDGQLAPWLNWGSNQPDNWSGIEHCVHFGKKVQMNDYRCDSPHPFFCERKLKVPVPLGYQFLEGQGFYKIYKEKITYKEAEAKCRGDGAHLAVPETYSEAVAINAIMRADSSLGEVWIGVSDEVTEGKFVTVHGTAMEDLEFSNWWDGEPSDASGQENCVEMHPPGYLNDDTCSHQQQFICELVL